MDHLENQSCPKTLSNGENQIQHSKEETVEDCSLSDSNELEKRFSRSDEIFDNFEFCTSGDLGNVSLEFEQEISQIKENDGSFPNMNSLNTTSNVATGSPLSSLQQENSIEILSSSSALRDLACTTAKPSSISSISESECHPSEIHRITSDICHYMVYVFMSTFYVGNEIRSLISNDARTSDENGAAGVVSSRDAFFDHNAFMTKSFQAIEERALHQTKVSTITGNTGNSDISHGLSDNSTQGISRNDEESQNKISSGAQGSENRSNKLFSSEELLDMVNNKYAAAGPSSMKSEIQWRVIDGRFVCSRCGKSFARKRNIVDHYRTHTVEKPFACDKCAKIFSQASYLARHRRTHTVQKPFPCDKCEKRFCQENSLAIHSRLHTGENLFACDKCVKRFRDANALAKHRSTHTSEKRYKCSICEKAFARSNGRKMHCKNVHNIM